MFPVGYLVIASTAGAGFVLLMFGVVGLALYLFTRYGQSSRDASGRPISPLSRGPYKIDRPLSIPLLVVGLVGAVLLIVGALR
jgi:hypothetical protein